MPATYKPIERRKVYELIAQQLLEQISERTLQPGDALPTERELTQLYGAGRSSVREALRMLESMGVIAPAGGGSFAVAPYPNPLNTSFQLMLSLDQATMLDVYEFRRMIECEAAGLAAIRHDDRHLAVMDAAIAEMSRGLNSSSSGRADHYIDGDLRFHLAIADATSNGVIVHAMGALRGLMRRALTRLFLVPESAKRSQEQHFAIREAIAARDADLARTAMRDHLVRVEADIRRASIPLPRPEDKHA